MWTAYLKVQSPCQSLHRLRLQARFLVSRTYASSSTTENEILVTYHQHDQVPTGIVLLTLNRIHAANAIGRVMLRQLQSCIQKLKKDTVEEEDIRCAILSSASTKVFSAGADLRERSTMTQIQASAFVSELRDTFQELASLPIPLIASIEGVAVGGGLELALTCDVLIAGANSNFGLPETSLGIIPGAGGTVRLPRKIGEARAKELIFTGKKINANTAYNYGLVEHVVEAGNADAQALEIAMAICKNGPLAIRAAKKAVDAGLQATSVIEALDAERICYESILETTDRLEGLAAFQEKRTPVYTGK